MAEYNPGNGCPENVGGHEPLQYNNPLEDVIMSRHLAGVLGVSTYQATVTMKVCKHCGVFYATVVTDTLEE
jgi:hypothetical protein